MSLQEKYIKIAGAFVEPYKKDTNIVGAVLGGGVSRGTGDVYSEIDIYFFVKGAKKSKNLPPRLPGIGGDINVNGVWFEFKIKEFEKERKREWGMVDKWDGKDVKILFDRNNKVRNLFKEKCTWKKGEKKSLSDEFRFKGNWLIALAEKFDKRGDLRHAHMLLNECLDSYVNAYFLLNNEFVPFYKWKYYYFNKLKKPNEKVRKKIYEAYKIKDYGSRDLWRRINLIKNHVIQGDLKEETWAPHKQKLENVKNFTKSLKEGVKYSDPFKDNKLGGSRMK